MCVSLILFAVGLKVGVTVLTPVTCPSASTVTIGISVADPYAPALTPLLPLCTLFPFICVAPVV